MKIFNTNENSWSEKVNFMDDNNVLVGFDMSQACCESFGWFVCSKEPTKIIEEENAEKLETEEYQFDVDYFKEVTPDEEYWDDGGIAIFRLVNGESEMFLALHNSHFHQLPHGFDMKVGGKTIRDSFL